MFETELKSTLAAACTHTEWSWISSTIKQLSPGDLDTHPDTSPTGTDDLYIALAMAGRMAGNKNLLMPSLGLVDWRQSDAARVLFLLRYKDCVNFRTIIETAYRSGDEAEREAIAKGLYWLDSDGAALDLALDICRTNIATMMTSIAQNNDYPGRYFSEHEFNQLVLKCLFYNFCITDIRQLRERRNPSLSRMCIDYMRERLAADRNTPPTIWLAIRVTDLPDPAAILTEFLIPTSEHKPSELEPSEPNTSQQEHTYQLLRSVAQDGDAFSQYYSIIEAYARQEQSDEIIQLIADIHNNKVDRL
ncbi:MAG: hypothetical protein ACI93R_003004 [Flavobacteriales bacterium]|jgi:hypothetical protein